MRESESVFGFSAGLGGRLVLAVGRSTALATTVQRCIESGEEYYCKDTQILRYSVLSRINVE